MPNAGRFTWLVAMGALLVFGSSARAVTCCPFCSAPSQTMAEQVAQADGVCLVQWVKGQPATEQDPGTTTYEIVQVTKGPKDSVRKGDRITLSRHRNGKPGDLFLLMGTRLGKANTIEWGSPSEITEPAYQYVAQSPSPEMPAAKRLAYFVNFLEFPDQLISNDAFGEFANASYKDIAAIAPKMPRDKIRNWITRPETPPTRLGVYGMLLGLCGKPEDAKVLAEKIAPNSEDYRLGVDGMISGYLLLTGTPGLDNIDTWKIKDQKVAFSETYAAIMALRFMHDFAGGKIANERILQSIRLVLDRPDQADLIIVDLARWNDWSIQDRLMQLYGKATPGVKRAIISYMLASTKAKPGTSEKTADATASLGAVTASGAQSPVTASSDESKINYVDRGKKYLEELRKRDPRRVKDAERFFFPN